MILTTCWVCAAPLDQNWLEKCVRCDTRYCSQACLRQHPDEECRSISRGGGAEQYHADKKYKEAVAEAVEACADDTILRALPFHSTALRRSQITDA